MSETCRAAKRDGRPCPARPLPDSTYCFGHDPQKAVERTAARKRGGYGRSSAARASRHLPEHLHGVQARLLRLMDDVEAGRIPPRAAEVVGTLAGRLIDLSRFAYELGEAKELTERLAALEAQLTALAERREAA
ncbi:MAG TPA: hypothetical protein VKV26_11390 [Dehalococcoidia bacterium]|nr:hypothetical protein [Dehalococcoidia bacterium]